MTNRRRLQLVLSLHARGQLSRYNDNNSSKRTTYYVVVVNKSLLKHIDGIERVQRQFTKRVHELKNLTYAERLAAMDLEPLELRRLKSDLVLYYKILNNLVHIPREYLPNEPPAPTIGTRSGVARLSVPHFTTINYDNNFFSRCVSCWNSLPVNVVNSQSVLSFKHSLATVDLRSSMHGNYLTTF